MLQRTSLGKALAALTWVAVFIAAGYGLTVWRASGIVSVAPSLYWATIGLLTAAATIAAPFLAIDQSTLKGASMKTIPWRALLVQIATAGLAVWWLGSLVWYVAKHEGW